MKLRHSESGQIVKVYGFAPYQMHGENMGGDFLIWTSDGWDFRSANEFEPIDSEHILDLEDEEE